MADQEDMTTDAGTEGAYTETVVEVVENRQRRVVFVTLISVLVLLLLLLVGSVIGMLYFTRGSGAPVEADLPEGITWVRSMYGWGETAETSLNKPTDVAVAPNGSIWTISSAQQIVGFNPDGSLKKLIQPVRGAGKGEVDTLEGIDVGPDGTIYVTDQGRKSVQRYNQDGEQLGEWGVNVPIEVAVSDDGELLAVTGLGSYGVLTDIQESTPTVVGTWGERGSGEDSFDLPHGIAFGDDASVFVSDTQNARVKALDRTGALLWVAGGDPVGISGSKETSETAIFQLPAGLTVDGRKRVVVVDPFGFNMTVLDSKTGKMIAQYGDYGSGDGLFAYPTGIDYDPDRDWFVVADTTNNRLQVLRIPGSGATPAAALRRNLNGPLWICCIPLFLLLVATVASILRRRARRAQEESREAHAGGTVA